MEETENPANSGVSEPTEGEQDESTEGGETPVIDTGDNSDENQDQEETPDVEEEPIETTEEENPAVDSSYEINATENPQTDLAAPTITLKKGAESIESGTAVSNRANDVKFEIAKEDGVSYFYTLNGEAPTASSTAYNTEVQITAPDKDAEETVTIKAIAHTDASGTEGTEGYVPAQDSTVATATVVFRAKAEGNTISVADGSDAATITIDGKNLSTASYPITDTTKDIEVTVSAKDKMFEVMYSVDGGVWTSAQKKETTEENPYWDVTYEEGTYIIPSEALSKNVTVCVFYLKEIALEWKNSANWRTVEINANVTREDSDSSNNQGIWGAQYPAVEDEKVNVLFAPQNTKVKLELTSIKNTGFAFGNVTYQKGNGPVTLGTVADDKKSATVEIANIENNDCKVSIDGESPETLTDLYVYVNDNDAPLEGKNGTYNVEPWKTYNVEAYDRYNNKAIALTDDAVTVTGGSVKKAANAQPGFSDPAAAEYAVTGSKVKLAANEAVANKSVTVQVKIGLVTKKAILKVGPAVTEVKLKDTKLDNKIPQSPGTKRSYPLTVTQPKSADTVTVDIKDIKIFEEGGNAEGRGLTEDEVCGDYIECTGSVSTGSLDITTEPFTGKTTKVVAKLVFLNNSEAGAKSTETTPDDGAVSEEITLTVENNKDTPTKYAEKLTVKATKAASSLYTGQTAVVATVDFGKDTYNRGYDVELYDVPECFEVIGNNGRAIEANEEGIVALDDTDVKSMTLDDSLQITLRAKKNNEAGASLGKQTIKVRTTYLAGKGDENIVQATGSANVTVVRGIESITATSAPQIYRSGTDRQAKAGTAKIAVTYNTAGKYADAKSATPRTKKVTYEVGSVTNGKFAVNNDILGHNSKGQPMVTVKNGTVTVDKEYVVKNSGLDEFAVRVVAADYEENKSSAVVGFKVAGEAAMPEGAKVVLVDSNNNEVEFDQSADKTPKNQLTINKLKGLKAIVVKGDPTGENGAYTDAEIVPAKLYTMTPAKGNVFVNANGTFTVNKLTNNVVIEAKANDGSRHAKVASDKFNVVYDDRTKATGDDAAKVSYTVDYDDKTATVAPASQSIKLDYPTGTVIHLNVTDKDGKKLNTENSIYDLKLAVKNAKVVKKSADNLDLDIIMTKSPVTVTLSDAKGKNPRTFSFTNIFLDDTTSEGKAYIKDLKAKTPNVSLTKGVKLYADVTGQKLSFTMNKAVEDARYVVISAQNEEADTKVFLNRLTEKKIKINPAVKEFTFTCDAVKMPTLKKGASIAFTFLNRDEEIITQTTKALTIKTTALKKSYKLDAKYTLSETDSVSVPLTGKGSAVAGVQFTELYNANIKGKVNKFKTAFELDAEHGKLSLKTTTDTDGNITAVARTWDATAESKKEHKDDWIGFVGYTVMYEDGTSDEFVSKIQAALAKTDKGGNILTAKKYAASAVNVLGEVKDADGNSLNTEKVGDVDWLKEPGVTSITIGKLPADIVAAYAVPDNSKNKVADAFKVMKRPGVLGDAEGQSMVDGNTVTIKVKPTADGKAGSYKGDLYVIPADSAYAKQKNLTDEVIKSRGVKLAITVNVKADNSKNKIKVTTKSVSFLGQEPEKLELNGAFKKYYYAEIPYTANVAAEITSVEMENINLTGPNKKDKEGNPLAPDGDKQNHLVFSEAVEKAGFVAVKANNKNALGLYIDADAFQQLVIKDAKEWSGSTFSKIKVTVHFAGEQFEVKNNKTTYKKAVPESFNISMTMPNPLDITRAEELLGIALGIIRDTVSETVKVNGIRDVRYNESDKVLTVIADNQNVQIETAMVKGTDDAIAEALLRNEELEGYVDLLTSIKVEVSENENTSAATEVKKQETENANKKMLKDLLAKYTDKLVKKLQDEGHDTPVWGDLVGRELKLTLTAKKGEVEESQSCTVRFIVYTEPEEDEGDELDIAIKNAVRRLNSAAAIPGIGEITYNVYDHKITITVSDDKQDIVASKNAGRDSTVQILLGELGEYMDEVDEVEFSHEQEYTIESLTVKRTDHNQPTEAYISNLIDKWTDKLAAELKSNATYGRLKGKELTVKTNSVKDGEKTYTIVYE